MEHHQNGQKLALASHRTLSWDPCALSSISMACLYMSRTVDLFADDKKLFDPTSQEQQATLQRGLNRIFDWTECWQLPLNLNKSVLCFTLECKTIEKIFGGVELRVTSSEKYLGVIVVDNLKFYDHVAEVINKTYRITAIIKRSSTYIDLNIFKELCNDLVLPIVEYGNVVWTPSFLADKKKIEGVQRRATKFVRKVRYLPFQEQIHHLAIPSLCFRRRGETGL